MSVLWCYELHLKSGAEEVTGPKEGRSYSFLDKCTCYQTDSSIFMFITCRTYRQCCPKPWPEKVSLWLSSADMESKSR